MTKIAGTFKIIENWEITRKDAYSGEILSSEKVCNLIVNSGLNICRDLLGNLSTPLYIRSIGIGTGATGAANGDTTLETEYTRELATITAPADYQIKFSKAFTFGSGVSETITEAALFDSNTVSGSKMLARTTFAGQAVDTDIILTINATITFSRV